MPPPPQLSSAWPTVRSSPYNPGWSPAPTSEAILSIPTKFVSAARYVHLEIFDLGADGVPLSSVRTLSTSTLVDSIRRDSLTPLGPPEVATESATRTAAPRARYMHPSFFDVDVQGMPVSTARVFATRTSIATGTAISISADTDILPNLPAWIFGFLAGCAAFLSIVAGALLLAQFRPQMQWTSSFGRWIKGKGQGSGYQKLQQEDYELDGVYRDDRGRALHRRDHGSDGLKNRKGRSKHLSIDTRQQYAGLGIAVHGPHNIEPTDLQQQSSEKSYSLASTIGVTVARRGSLTAPLPSTKHLPLPIRRPSSAFEASHTLESGSSATPRISISTPEIFDYASPVHKGVRSPQYTTRSGTGMLERISDGVAGAADKVARRFYDHVDPNKGPEDGLWLPVRDSEREVKSLKGVFVGH